MGKKYKKLLKDPRWQKKRLKVLERAGWECERCGDSKSELHVHHTFYDGRKPWKYPKSSLECLCKSCHEGEHFESKEEEEEEEEGMSEEDRKAQRQRDAQWLREQDEEDEREGRHLPQDHISDDEQSYWSGFHS
jgi:hypothetical protein